MSSFSFSISLISTSAIVSISWISCSLTSAIWKLLAESTGSSSGADWMIYLQVLNARFADNSL